MYEISRTGPGCHDSVLALVLASSRGRALEGLTAWQTKAAVPFGAQHRLVDFVLSNCVNSEIRRIALLTQYKSQSLIRHVHSGWGFLHGELGEFVEIWPAQQQDGERWYRGSVDAVYQNLDLIDATGARYVLVLASDQLYALDYSLLVEEHVARRADVTVACAHSKATSQVAIAGADGSLDRIDSLADDARDATPHLAPMGVYLFDAQFLAKCLRQDEPHMRSADFAHGLVPRLAGAARAFVYVCDDRKEPSYWRTLNTIDRFWNAHMELLDDSNMGLLGNPEWPVFTHYEPLPAARVLRHACVDTAVIGPGAVVAGDISHSVISARCRVGAGAVIKDSVLLPGAVIGEDCSLERVVVDSNCEILPGTQLRPPMGRSPSPCYAGRQASTPRLVV